MFCETAAVKRNSTLDVRPLLASGREPFPEIRQRVDQLAIGETLTLISPFLPSPLIEMLRAQNFEASPARRPDGVWSTLFTRR